ncbi:MAG: hypothetical protein WAV07_04090, partial [Candidatus Contendobacter sp.]
ARPLSSPRATRRATRRAGRVAVAAIARQANAVPVQLLILDLASFASIQRAAEQFKNTIRA